MMRRVVMITAALTIVSLGAIGGAEAGASASAPSKYSARTHAMTASQPTTVRRASVRTDEFSSAARTRQPGH